MNPDLGYYGRYALDYTPNPRATICVSAILYPYADFACMQILSNFGVDVLEALSSTCTLFTRHSIGLTQLVADFAVALLLITAHGCVLMCQVGVVCVWGGGD